MRWEYQQIELVGYLAAAWDTLKLILIYYLHLTRNLHISRVK